MHRRRDGECHFGFTVNLMLKRIKKMPPTADDIRSMRDRLVELRNRTIPARRNKQQGRYSKYETARRTYALPGVMYGKLPSPMLALFDTNHVNPKGGDEKKFMDKWRTKYHADPRSPCCRRQSTGVASTQQLNRWSRSGFGPAAIRHLKLL